ncbi:MAG: NAD(P)H-dependent oxidoreductase [Pseudomonadota bacterium]
MARLLVYFAHPALHLSTVNVAMRRAAQQLDGFTFVDLYAEYPRFDIDVDKEQARLRDHDIIVFQFPFFWYSTPSLIKEWQDLVLEHGFAYGHGGEALAGKTMLLALTAAGPEEAYATEGYQHYPIRTFLTPLERTAGLCKMRFSAPYVMFGSLRAVGDDRLGPHVDGYVRLLTALRDDRLDLEAAAARDLLTPDTLPLSEDA